MVLVELLGASAPTKPEDNPNWAMSTGSGGGGIGHARAIGRLSVPPEQIINHKVGAGLAPAPVGQIILDSNGRNGRKRGKPRFSQTLVFPHSDLTTAVRYLCTHCESAEHPLAPNFAWSRC